MTHCRRSAGSQYGPPSSERAEKELSVDEWVSVLKLTTMWQFPVLRKAAIDNLKPLLGEDPVRWIGLARTYDVHEWMFPALDKLAQRREPLRLHEAELLGIATAVKMAEVRESRDRASAGSQSGSYYGRPYHSFGDEIRRVFKDELASSKT